MQVQDDATFQLLTNSQPEDEYGKDEKNEGPEMVMHSCSEERFSVPDSLFW
jgi:hypothetical protein